MNTLKNRKTGDKVYYKGIVLTVKVNLGDKMICEEENGKIGTFVYSDLRLPIHKVLNNWYEYISGFRNNIEQKIIEREQSYLLFLFYSIVVIAALLFFLNVILL